MNHWRITYNSQSLLFSLLFNKMLPIGAIKCLWFVIQFYFPVSRKFMTNRVLPQVMHPVTFANKRSLDLRLRTYASPWLVVLNESTKPACWTPKHQAAPIAWVQLLFFCFFFSFIFISWRLITLQYYRGFCHTLTWISHGFTCMPHPDLPSHLSLYLIPLGLPSASGLSTCLMHPTWAGDHPR